MSWKIYDIAILVLKLHDRAILTMAWKLYDKAILIMSWELYDKAILIMSWKLYDKVILTMFWKLYDKAIIVTGPVRSQPDFLWQSMISSAKFVIQQHVIRC